MQLVPITTEVESSNPIQARCTRCNIIYILIYPCLSGCRYMVCPVISSYSFGATALIFCRMFIHIMEVCMSTGFWFSSNILKMTGSHFVRPSGYRYMVCSAISSYSFITTALIFCMMFIHIMKVCMSTRFWWSGGGIICVLLTHFIFKTSLLTKQLCPWLSSAGAYFFSSLELFLL